MTSALIGSGKRLGWARFPGSTIGYLYDQDEVPDASRKGRWVRAEIGITGKAVTVDLEKAFVIEDDGDS